MKAPPTERLPALRARVAQRLEAVDLLTEMQPHLRGWDRVTIDDPSWSHPWIYFDSLRNYLLLTCFDILGQAEGRHVDFDGWLRAKRFARDRQEAVDAIATTDATASAMALHELYKTTFGVSRAFFRFIREVLPEDQRLRLMKSVLLREVDIAAAREIRDIPTDLEKEKALFALRNQFTHAGANIGSVAGGLFEENQPIVTEDGRTLYGYRPIAYMGDGPIRTEIAVRLWPSTLAEVVRAGLEALAQRIGADAASSDGRGDKA